MEARAGQSLGSADALKGSHDVQRERDEPSVIDVGQFALGLRPDELVRVEFRRVAWNPEHVDAGMSSEKGLHVPTPMIFPPWRVRRLGFWQLYRRPCRNSAQTPIGL